MAGGQYFVGPDGKHAPATILDAGSKTFFGVEFPTGSIFKLFPVAGCTAVYSFLSSADSPQPEFQVDYYLCGSEENRLIVVNVMYGQTAASIFSWVQ